MGLNPSPARLRVGVDQENCSHTPSSWEYKSGKGDEDFGVFRVTIRQKKDLKICWKDGELKNRRIKSGIKAHVYITFRKIMLHFVFNILTFWPLCVSCNKDEKLNAKKLPANLLWKLKSSFSPPGFYRNGFWGGSDHYGELLHHGHATCP